MGTLRWLDILISPVLFMRTQAKRSPHLLMAVTIFSIFLITKTVGQYLIFNSMLSHLPPSIQSDLGWAHFGFSISLVAGGISDIVFWILGAGILVCLAILLDGMGEYRKLLELTGCGHLPLALFGLATLVFAISYNPDLHFTAYEDTDFHELRKNNPTAFERAMENIEKKLVQETSSQTFSAFRAAKHCATLWSVILFILALMESFQLTALRSTFAVMGIVLLYILLEVVRQMLVSGKGI